MSKRDKKYMEHCKICNVPEDSGYLIAKDHFKGQFLVEKQLPHGLHLKTSERVQIMLYNAIDNQYFISHREGMEVLEMSGNDLLENIDFSERYCEIKIVDGECQFCRADRQQAKLF